MHIYDSNYQVVANAFTVIDIAEPIRIFVSPDVSKLQVWNELIASENKDWFAIVKDENHTYGFYALDYGLDEDLEKTAGTSAIPIISDLLVPFSTSVLDVIPMFTRQHVYFVLYKNQISHVISFNDLDKLPVKISIFSLFLELEANLIKLISSTVKPIDDYIACLSEKRIAEIKELCIEKYQQYTARGALLSTNFIDKKKMISKDKDLRLKLGFSSNTELERKFGPISKIRNCIAHSDSVLMHLNTPDKLNSFINEIYSINNKVIEVTKEY